MIEIACDNCPRSYDADADVDHSYCPACGSKNAH